MSHRLSTVVIASSLALCASGCAIWKEAATEPAPLPTPKMSSDSVRLEIGFLQLAPQDEAVAAQLWSELDEQHLPLALRNRLSANGIRCGLCGTQLPQPLTDLIEQACCPISVNDEGESEQRVDQQSRLSQRHLHCRAGRRAEIASSQTIPNMALLTRGADGVRGKTLTDAQCLLAVKTHPQGDGQVKVELTPEVHHGQPKQSWEGQNGVFRQVTSRDREVLADLQLAGTLSPGQTLVLSSTEPSLGLGQHFFTESDESGQPARKLLLIRLTHTQHDDLFAPERILAPIATSAE